MTIAIVKEYLKLSMRLSELYALKQDESPEGEEIVKKLYEMWPKLSSIQRDFIRNTFKSADRKKIVEDFCK